MCNKPLPKVLLNEVQYQDLFFYQKSEVLYALTFHFVKQFLPPHGDRTVDQMVQAARSGKQNIIEGFADGMTSTEMQLKLLNVARSSLKELRADYEDYLSTRHLALWGPSHPRYDMLLAFCRQHNKVSDYEPYFGRWSDEEQCNIALTLLHMTDKMMKSYLSGLDQQFVTQGGMKERMHAARTAGMKTSACASRYPSSSNASNSCSARSAIWKCCWSRSGRTPNERTGILRRLYFLQIILAEILAIRRQLMMHEVGQYLLQLEEESFAWLVAVGEHMETN